MCNFIKLHRNELFGSGSKGCYGVERVKEEAWEECRLCIVAAGGRPDRTWRKIRKKWQDISSKAKKYNTGRTAYLNGTGMLQQN